MMQTTTLAVLLAGFTAVATHAQERLPQEEALDLAPEQARSAFAVPKVIG